MVPASGNATYTWDFWWYLSNHDVFVNTPSHRQFNAVLSSEPDLDRLYPPSLFYTKMKTGTVPRSSDWWSSHPQKSQWPVVRCPHQTTQASPQWAACCASPPKWPFFTNGAPCLQGCRRREWKSHSGKVNCFVTKICSSPKASQIFQHLAKLFATFKTRLLTAVTAYSCYPRTLLYATMQVNFLRICAWGTKPPGDQPIFHSTCSLLWRNQTRFR